MRTGAFGLLLLLTAIAINAQSFEAHWDAEDAFMEAGLLLSYQSIDGRHWPVAAGVELIFERSEAEFEPQCVFNPQACAWLTQGARLRIEAPGLYITEVKIESRADRPLLDGEVLSEPQGELAVDGTTCSWRGEAPERIIFSQPGPFESVQSPGGAVAIRSVTVSWQTESAIKFPTIIQSERAYNLRGLPAGPADRLRIYPGRKSL